MKFTQVQPNPESLSPAKLAEHFGVHLGVAVGMAMEFLSEMLYVNDTYQVSVSKPHRSHDCRWPAVIHMTIIPLDGKPCHDWPAFQRIKNELLGGEYEAVEVYPAESRLVDCGNAYHLWCACDPTFRFPFGWNVRMVKGQL